MKTSELRKLIREEVREAFDASTPLWKKTKDLYKAVAKTKRISYGTYDNIDKMMVNIVKKLGNEEFKVDPNMAYATPYFKNFNDKSLMGLQALFNAILKYNKQFTGNEKFDGKNIISASPKYSGLASKLSDLYNKVVMMRLVDDEALDGEMEMVIKKVGYTPEQQNKKGAYKFAFGEHPEWEKLSDQQMRALEPLLKAVAESEEFDRDVTGTWDITKKKFVPQD